MKGEIALFSRIRRVSGWHAVIDRRVKILVTENIALQDVVFWARIGPEPHMMLPIDAYIGADLRAGDTVLLQDLVLDMHDGTVGGFQSVTDEELPEPDEDYDEDPYGNIEGKQ